MVGGLLQWPIYEDLLKNMLPSDLNISIGDIADTTEPGVFSVRSQNSKTPELTYTVDIIRGFCSCFVGCSGKLYKHASAVLLHLDMKLGTAYSVVSDSTKCVVSCCIGFQYAYWLAVAIAVHSTSKRH